MLSPKPWQREPGARLILGLIITICLGGLLLAFADRLIGGLSSKEQQVLRLVMVAFFYQGIALFWIGLFFREHGVGWSEAIGLSDSQRARTIGLGILGGVCVVPVAMGLVTLFDWILTQTAIAPEEQLAVRILKQTITKEPVENLLGAFKLTWMILAVTVVPAAEEILFRGILYPSLKQRGSAWFAFCATSILFAEIHFNLVTLVPLTVLAMLFTWLYEETDSLLAPIIAHSIFNGANILLLEFGESLRKMGPF